MNILESLPIMPVSSVLFPGAPTSLYIHEQRYRDMLDECLARGDGLFGVALPKSGQEQEGTVLPHTVGTLAKVVAVTSLPDQSSLVMVRGGPRFRIRRYMELRPVVEAEVEVLDDDSSLAPAELMMAQEAHEQLQRLTALLLETMETDQARTDIPDDPVRLSWAVAAYAQASVAVQQRLLEENSVAARLEMAMPMLREEIGHYEVMLAARRRLDELGISSDDAPFSRN